MSVRVPGLLIRGFGIGPGNLVVVVGRPRGPLVVFRDPGGSWLSGKGPGAPWLSVRVPGATWLLIRGPGVGAGLPGCWLSPGPPGCC